VLRTASGSMKSLMKIANRQWADWCTLLHYRNPQWWPEKYGKLMRMGGPSLQVPLKFHGLLRCHQFLSSLWSYIQSRSSVSVICLHENTIVSLYSTSSRCTSTQKKYSWERIGKVHNFTLKTWGTVGQSPLWKDL
jgi:hypothetical protein